MKKLKLTSVLIQGGLLVAFAGGFYFFTQTQVKPTQVYTYTRDIQANTVIQKQDLAKKYIPSDAVTPDMVTNESEAVGKAVETKVYPGEYAIKPKLIESKKTDLLTQMDLSNYRKISIEVEMKDAVGGNLKKGDTVDLAFVGQGQTKSGDSEFTYAKTFLQDILVYNVVDDTGKKYIDQTENTALTNNNGEEVASGTLSIVTLAVTGEQAEQIQARLEKGKIKILGRFEESIDNTTSGYVLGEYSPVVSQTGNPESKK